MNKTRTDTLASPPQPPREPAVAKPAKRPPESGGGEGPDPTRYGDWERKGRCIDF